MQVVDLDHLILCKHYITPETAVDASDAFAVVILVVVLVVV